MSSDQVRIVSPVDFRERDTKMCGTSTQPCYGITSSAMSNSLTKTAALC